MTLDARDATPRIPRPPRSHPRAPSANCATSSAAGNCARPACPSGRSRPPSRIAAAGTGWPCPRGWPKSWHPRCCQLPTCAPRAIRAARSSSISKHAALAGTEVFLIASCFWTNAAARRAVAGPRLPGGSRYHLRAMAALARRYDTCGDVQTARASTSRPSETAPPSTA